MANSSPSTAPSPPFIDPSSLPKQVPREQWQTSHHRVEATKNLLHSEVPEGRLTRLARQVGNTILGEVVKRSVTDPHLQGPWESIVALNRKANILSPPNPGYTAHRPQEEANLLSEAGHEKTSPKKETEPPASHFDDQTFWQKATAHAKNRVAQVSEDVHKAREARRLKPLPERQIRGHYDRSVEASQEQNTRLHMSVGEHPGELPVIPLPEDANCRRKGTSPKASNCSSRGIYSQDERIRTEAAARSRLSSIYSG